MTFLGIIFIPVHNPTFCLAAAIALRDLSAVNSTKQSLSISLHLLRLCLSAGQLQTPLQLGGGAVNLIQPPLLSAPEAATAIGGTLFFCKHTYTRVHIVLDSYNSKEKGTYLSVILISQTYTEGASAGPACL